MRFIHSSDLQIGKAFGFFDPETANILQDARQAVVRTLGEAAVEAGATAVLIAGDIYEKQQMSDTSLLRAIENMRAFGGVQWHLMPGNHDHFRENGLWDRLARMQLPSNVTLHVKRGAVQIADSEGAPVFLLPDAASIPGKRRRSIRVYGCGGDAGRRDPYRHGPWIGTGVRFRGRSQQLRFPGAGGGCGSCLSGDG